MNKYTIPNVTKSDLENEIWIIKAVKTKTVTECNAFLGKKEVIITAEIQMEKKIQYGVKQVKQNGTTVMFNQRS